MLTFSKVLLMSLPAFSKNNSIIKNGQILSSIIDMDTNKITTLGTPTAESDAVTKKYCDDNSLSGIPTITVTLSGTNWNIILAVTFGVFDILVSNVVSGGPCAKFTVMKPEASRNASIQRWGSNAGTTTMERLEMRWSPNTGIELRKNGSGHDGTYKVRYFSV
jgi:hypothetical protein